MLCSTNDTTILITYPGPVARLWLPYLNFGVASTALGFQTMVLYPWHEELEHEFKKLKTEHKELLQYYHDIKLQRLEQLETRVLAAEKAQKVGFLEMQYHGIQSILLSYLIGKIRVLVTKT